MIFGGARLDTMSQARRGELRRGKFGFVFQSGQLVPELSAVENVALPIVLSLAIIAATFPLLARITGPDVARNE